MILLEVLVALAVFVMAAAIIGSAMGRCIQDAVDVRQGDRAANLARSAMAQFALGQEEMIAQSLMPFEAGGDDLTAPVGWSIEFETELLIEWPGMERVTVIVRGTGLSRPAEHRLTQLMRAPVTEELIEGEDLP